MACNMYIVSKTFFVYSFKVLCIACVITMVGYWLYKFDVEDRDIGVVDYIYFEDNSRIKYPVVSLCFQKPFSISKIARTDPNVSVSDYLSYLQGDLIAKGPYNFDYLNITLNLEDYLTRYEVTLRNGTFMNSSKMGMVGTFSHQVSFNGLSEWEWFLKCFELSWEISRLGSVKESYVAYNRTNLLRDAWISSPLHFEFYMHYAGQFLLAQNDPKYFKTNLRKSLEVMIEDVEILKSRNSRNRKCTPYDEQLSFDDMVRTKHMIQNGCTLPYVSTSRNFPKCNTQEKIKKSAYRYQNVRTEYYPVSCQRLSKISYRTEWVDTVNYLGYDEDEFAIGIIFPQYFRSIELTKEVDVHSLIGNIGGYVGLFLGNCIKKI